jgi:hypothetical protein
VNLRVKVSHIHFTEKQYLASHEGLILSSGSLQDYWHKLGRVELNHMSLNAKHQGSHNTTSCLKKKVEPSRRCSISMDTKLNAMVDFPAPGAAYSQNVQYIHVVQPLTNLFENHLLSSLHARQNIYDSPIL